MIDETPDLISPGAANLALVVMAAILIVSVIVDHLRR